MTYQEMARLIRIRQEKNENDKGATQIYISPYSNFEEIYEKLKRRKDIVEEELGNIPGTKLLPTESGMLTWINVKKLGTSNEVYNYILENAKILVNEGSPYGSEGEGYLRIVSGAILDDDEAREALHKIRQALIELGKTKLK